MTVSHREATPDDRRLIVSAWSSSYKHSHSAGMIYTDDYAEIMHRQIERILDWGSTSTIVAYESRDPSFVFGFMSGDVTRDVPIAWYVYVKTPYRRMGMARRLFEAIGINPSHRFIYACKTAIVPALAGKIPAAKFSPSVARYPKEQAA